MGIGESEVAGIRLFLFLFFLFLSVAINVQFFFQSFHYSNLPQTNTNGAA